MVYRSRRRMRPRALLAAGIRLPAVGRGPELAVGQEESGLLYLEWT